eukprot:15105187-Alexandrium_andersonii.AAC.1
MKRSDTGTKRSLAATAWRVGRCSSAVPWQKSSISARARVPCAQTRRERGWWPATSPALLNNAKAFCAPERAALGSWCARAQS